MHNNPLTFYDPTGHSATLTNSSSTVIRNSDGTSSIIVYGTNVHVGGGYRDVIIVSGGSSGTNVSSSTGTGTVSNAGTVNGNVKAGTVNNSGIIVGNVSANTVSNSGTIGGNVNTESNSTSKVTNNGTIGGNVTGNALVVNNGIIGGNVTLSIGSVSNSGGFIGGNVSVGIGSVDNRGGFIGGNVNVGIGSVYNSNGFIGGNVNVLNGSVNSGLIMGSVTVNGKDTSQFFDYARLAAGQNPLEVFYDREAAVAYALKHAFDYNPDYLAMDSLGAWFEYFFMYYVNLGMADCTNFTSQALFAGGLAMNDDWHYYKTFNTFYMKGGSFYGSLYKTPDGTVTSRAYDYNFTPAWSLARSQYEYFSNPANGYINGEVIIISGVDQIANAANNMGIQKGDLMYFGSLGASQPHHASIITKIENDEIHFSAHTSSRSNEPLTLRLGDGQVFIVRINDQPLGKR